MNKELKFIINQMDEESVYRYLAERDADFTPKLSDKLDISSYSHKIHKKATLYSAHAGTVIGLCACYANNYETLEAFITHFSVHPAHYGSGLAVKLINFCIADLEAKEFRSVKLEVSRANTRACTFYMKAGFEISDQHSTPERCYMIKEMN